MTDYRPIVRLAIFVLLTPLLMGMGLADSRFYVSSVTITGPSKIRNGQSANYIVTAVIARNGIALNAPIVGTLGPPPPRIRPSIYSGNRQLTFSEVTIPRNVNTITTSLTLSCVNREIRGDRAGSGHGSPSVTCFLWWCWNDDVAQINGHLNETESVPLGVVCAF